MRIVLRCRRSPGTHTLLTGNARVQETNEFEARRKPAYPSQNNWNTPRQSVFTGLRSSVGMPSDALQLDPSHRQSPPDAVQCSSTRHKPPSPSTPAANRACPSARLLARFGPFPKTGSRLRNKSSPSNQQLALQILKTAFFAVYNFAHGEHPCRFSIRRRTTRCPRAVS